MGKTPNKEISVKASEAKPSDKPPPRDKSLEIETKIRFYTLEDDDDTAGGEESEILFVHYYSLAVYKQKLFKRKFPYINTFNHEGTGLECFQKKIRKIHYWLSQFSVKGDPFAVHLLRSKNFSEYLKYISTSSIK